MKPQGSTPASDAPWIRWVFFASICLPVLLLVFNAHDSAIAKTPLFVLGSSFVFALLLFQRMRNRHIEYETSNGNIPIVGFLIFAWCSLLYTASLHTSIAELLRLTACVMIFFTVQQLVSTKRDLQSLILVVAILTAIVCSVGFVQYFFAEQLTLEFYLGEARRVGSTLGNPSFLGGFIALVLPLFVSQALATHSNKRWFYGILAVCLGVLLLFTQSRSGIVATTVALIVLATFSTRGWRAVLPLLIAVVVAGTLVIVLFAPQLTQRFEETFDYGPQSTLERRLFFWEAGVKAFQDAPLLGHGIGTFERVMVQYRSPEYWIVKSEDIVPHAHNEFIELGTELGIIGLGLFGWLLWRIFGTGFRSVRNGKEWERLTALGMMCGLLGLLLDNLTNVSLRQTPVLMMMWLVIGMIMSRAFLPITGAARTFSLKVSPAVAIVPILAWALFAIVYSPMQRDVVRADGHFMKALLALGMGKQEIAIGELREAVALNPAAHVARSNLALELLKANKPKETRSIIDTLLSDYPLYPKAHIVRSVANLTLNETSAAIDDIRIEQAHRTHPEVYYVESLIHQNRGDSTAERVALLNQIASCRRGAIPTNIGYACTRLRILTPSDSLEGLEKILVQLSSQFPTERAIVENLSLVHQSLGDTSFVTRPRQTPAY
ncbi:MAG: O-antigen ligase family protein [Bacteroidota bacterium]